MHFLLAASAVCATLLSSASGLVITGKEASVGRSLAAGWAYYGCAEMPSFVRATVVDEGGMTREICARYCQDKHYTAAGVSDGSACHCWNGPSTGLSLLTDAECTLPCSGDSHENCGGRDVLSVFTSVNPSSPIELRSKPVRKGKCKGGKSSVPSNSSTSISYTASSTVPSTFSSSSATSISTSTSSFVSESTSSIPFETSSSDDATITSSSVTSSSTVSEASSTMTFSEATTTTESSSTSSDNPTSTTSSEMTSSSSSTISETSTPATSSEDVTTTSDVPSTSSSTISDVPTSTTSSEVVTESSSTTSTERSTVTSETSSSTTSADVTTTTSSSTTSETSTSATATGPCATVTGSYVLQGSGTGDFVVDGNFAQLQSAFGSGYRVSFSANRQNAQQFRFQPDCTFTTADGGLLAMIGGSANLHTQYFFPSVQAASVLVNVNWEADICSMNADSTLTCTAMQQSIFQVTPGDPLLQLGDQNYGEQVTVNLVPVPGSNF